MKFRLILSIILVAATFSSCSTAYRTGQTPDDVYYSPGRETDAYVQVDNKKENGRYYRSNSYEDYDDRWLRMRVRNRYRWDSFNDYDWNDWRYNSWSYNYYSPYSWNSYWNNYYLWNSYYNPYCSNIIVVNPKVNPTVYTKVRNFSLGSYTNTNYNNNNISNNKAGMRLSPNRGYNNSNSLGNSIRRAFSGSSNGGRDRYYTPSSSERPSRTYTPPSSSGSSSSGSRSSGSSSSGSSGGSSGGGVSRPGRGG